MRKSFYTLALASGALLAAGAVPSSAALADPAAPNVKAHTAVHCDNSADIFLENNTDKLVKFELFYPNETEETVSVKAHHVVKKLVPARFADYLAISIPSQSYYLPLAPFNEWPTDCGN